MPKVLIVNERVMEVFGFGSLPFPEPLPPNVRLIDAPGSVQPGWFYRNNVFTAPTATGEYEPPFHQNYINAQLAKQELLFSDRVCIRFFEEGDPVSQEWKDYRIALRQIILMEKDTSSAPTPLPPRPPLPYAMTTPAW